MDVFSALMVSSRGHFFHEALRAAHELGIFAALPCPMRALALPPRRLRPLLDVLVLEGMLRREVRDGEPWLCPSLAEAPQPPPSPPGPRAGWSRLAEVIRDNRPLEAEDAFAVRYQQHLAATGAAAAEEVAEELASHFEAGGVLLDAGGGLGTYAAALLRQAGAATALLLERPAVVALAQEHLAPLAPRVALRAGDLFTDDLGQGNRAALLCNLLHLYDEERCVRLIRRAAASLEPGGELLIKDLFVETDRSNPATGLYFALNMALYTEGGDVYDVDTLCGWLIQADLGEIRVRRLRASPDSVLVRAVAPVGSGA